MTSSRLLQFVPVRSDSACHHRRQPPSEAVPLEESPRGSDLPRASSGDKLCIRAMFLCPGGAAMRPGVFVVVGVRAHYAPASLSI